MFNKNQISAFIFCVVAIMLFYMSFYHHQKIGHDELTYAKTIANVTSSILPDTEVEGPSHTSSGVFIDEDRAILYIFGFSQILLLVSLSVLLIDRMKNGKSRHFKSLIFLSVGVSISVFITAARIGLLNYV